MVPQHICQAWKGKSTVQCGKESARILSKPHPSTEKTKRAPYMLTAVVAVPLQKLPSSDNESSIESVKEDSFCPYVKGIVGDKC